MTQLLWHTITGSTNFRPSLLWRHGGLSLSSRQTSSLVNSRKGGPLLGCKVDFHEVCPRMDKGRRVKPVSTGMSAAAQVKNVLLPPAQTLLGRPVAQPVKEMKTPATTAVVGAGPLGAAKSHSYEWRAPLLDGTGATSWGPASVDNSSMVNCQRLV